MNDLLDDFYKIDQGEAYKTTRYMDQEVTLSRFFKQQLTNLGYATQDIFDRVWERNGKIVVVCLSDDYYVNLPSELKSNPDAIIITDNHWVGEPVHQLFKLPTSYFGIYGYTPKDSVWRPERRVNFSINRFSQERLLLLLELIEQSGNVSAVLENDYVNFNGFMPFSENTQIKNRQFNFDKQWETVENTFRTRYGSYTNNLKPLIPIKNHNHTHEYVHISTWVNMVVETYGGDVTCTFSEKTFRALVTPVPWTLYAGYGAIESLSQMGFDTLSDLVDHRYNKLLESATLLGIDKMQQYIFTSLDTYRNLAGLDFEYVKNRCVQAALHNQQKLANMRQQWPLDFAKWWPAVAEQLI
jgi:hypothetical protein